MNDQTFVERQTQLTIDFAYTLPLGGEKNIYLGLKVGTNNVTLNAAHLATYQSADSDPSFFLVNPDQTLEREFISTAQIETWLSL